jgi:chromosome segregation ATPase
MRSIRRVDIVASWRHAREQYATLQSELDQLRRDLEHVRGQRDELQQLLRELLDARRAVKQAEANLQELYREREIRRARMAVRSDVDTLQ